jgi:hypothetical protein
MGEYSIQHLATDRHADTGERETLVGTRCPSQWNEAVTSHRYHRFPMLLSTVMPRVPR